MFDDTARREAADRDARNPARVAALLEAAAAPVEPGPMKGEAEALAAFVASRNAPRRGAPVRSTLVTAKVAVAAALSGVLLTGGVGAAAASGVLPGAAQDTASDWLSKVGVTVPRAGHRPVHDGGSGAGDAVAGDDAGADDAQGKGEVVSEAARDDETSGRGKGATVSELASDGRSRADEHGRPRGDRGRPRGDRGRPSDDEDGWRDGSESDDGEADGREVEDDRGQRASRSHSRERTGMSGRPFDRHDADPGDEGAATDADDTDRDDATEATGDDEADGTDGGRPAAGSGESP